MTNADKIRAMTDEKLAVWIADRVYGMECSNCPAYEPCVPTMEDMTCKDHILEWLQEEANE